MGLKAKHPRYAGPGSEESIIEFWKDRFLMNEVRPKGFHYFECPLHVMVAKEMWTLARFGEMPVEWREERMRYTRTGTGVEWDLEEFELWSSWASSVSCS